MTIQEAFVLTNKAIVEPKTKSEYNTAVKFFNIERFEYICKTCSRKDKCNMKELDISKCNFYRKE